MNSVSNPLSPTDVAIIHNHPVHYKHLLFTALQRRGMRFCVVFAAATSDLLRDVMDISARSYPNVVLSKAPFRPFAPETALSAWRTLNSLQPAVVILGGYHFPAVWAGWLWAQTHRRNTVLWFESNQFDWPRVFWKEWIKRVFVWGCDGAHVYGSNSKAYLEILGMPRDRIGVKRAVVDVDNFSSVQSTKASHGEGGRVLLYVGRLVPEKNLPFVLRALQRVNSLGLSNALRLVLVGAGTEEESLRSLTAELGLQGAVEFAGHKTQAELRPYLGLADALILASTREAYGLVVLEAMVARLPILVSDHCGCAVDMVHPNTGWSFSPFDLGSLVDAMARLCDAPRELLSDMGKQSKAATSDCGPEQCASRVISMVRALRSQPRKPRLSTQAT